MCILVLAECAYVVNWEKGVSCYQTSVIGLSPLTAKDQKCWNSTCPILFPPDTRWTSYTLDDRSIPVPRWPKSDVYGHLKLACFNWNAPFKKCHRFFTYPIQIVISILSPAARDPLDRLFLQESCITRYPLKSTDAQGDNWQSGGSSVALEELGYVHMAGHLIGKLPIRLPAKEPCYSELNMAAAPVIICHCKLIFVLW